MCLIEIDNEKRYLYIELENFNSNTEYTEEITDFWIKLASMGKDAFIICDISGFKTNTRESRIFMKRLIRLVDSYKPKAVIRIVKYYSGTMFFDRVYRSVKAGYQVIRVNTKEKAVDAIEKVNMQSLKLGEIS